MKKTTYQKKLRDSFAPFRAEALKRYAADKPKKDAKKTSSIDRAEAMREIVQRPEIHAAGMKYMKAKMELKRPENHAAGIKYMKAKTELIKAGLIITDWNFAKDRQEYDMEFCHVDTGTKAWVTLGRI